MAFCDVTRLKALELLRNGEKCATELQEKIGIGQSNLSHHMKILLDSGILTARKVGKWTHYSLCEMLLSIRNPYLMANKNPY